MEEGMGEAGDAVFYSGDEFYEVFCSRCKMLR